MKKVQKAQTWQSALDTFIADYATVGKRGDTKFLGLRFGQVSGQEKLEDGTLKYVDFLDVLTWLLGEGLISNLSVDKATNQVVLEDGKTPFSRQLVIERLTTVLGWAIGLGPKGGMRYASSPVKGANGPVTVAKAGKPSIVRYAPKGQ